MGKASGLLIGATVTLLGIAWFYFVMYKWLWLGLVNSTTIGYVAGFGIMLVIFFIVSIYLIAILGIGFAIAIWIGGDSDSGWRRGK